MASKIRLLTLFTNQQCSLCSKAKNALKEARATQSPARFEWIEVDIHKDENKGWFDKYCFDVPVIHFDEQGKHKIMHHISKDDVLKKLKEVESSSLFSSSPT